jgi:hypothetical protein
MKSYPPRPAFDVEGQGANGRFQVRDRDGAMTEIRRKADPPHVRASLRYSPLAL